MQPAKLRSVRRPENVERAIAQARAEAEKRRREEKNRPPVQKGLTPEEQQVLQSYLTAAPITPAIPVSAVPSSVQLSLGPRTMNTRSGGNARFYIDIDSSIPVNVDAIALKFDKEKLKVSGVTAGEMLPASPPVTFNVEDDTLLVKFNPKPVMVPKGRGRILIVDFMTSSIGQSEIAIISKQTRILDGKNGTLRAKSTGARISIIE